MGCIQSDASQHLPDTFMRNLCAHHQSVDVFSQYKVIRELGNGAFGIVNLVERISTSDQYAMKVITIGPNAKLPELRKEIDIWRGLQHPNVVRLVETYETSSHIYMIMEVCTGGHMLNAVKVRKQAYPEEVVKDYIRKLAACIYYLHLNNICHRDIKLENILLESEAEGSDIKLCDFGASTLFRQGVMMQTVLGSVVYMAPEFLEGHYTQACDMWSLGVVMYMLLSNSMPFHGDTEEDLIESIFAAKVDFEDDIWTSISVEAKSLIKKLLHANTADRYTALQVLIHPWVKSAKMEMLQPAEIDTVITRLSEYASFHSMKRAALLAVAFSSPSIDLTDMRKAYNQLNVLHNGVLTMKDLEQASLVEKYPNVDFHKIFNSLDMEGSQQVNFLEFTSAVMTIGTQNEKILRKAFQLFNPNDSTGICEDGLAKLMGQDFDEAAVKDMIRSADLDKDGAISYQEFVQLINSKPMPKESNVKRIRKSFSKRLSDNAPEPQPENSPSSNRT